MARTNTPESILSSSHPTYPNSDTSGIGGHPRGLTPLFFTEMWERFSYYGMRAILMLYMVAPAARGGLGFDIPTAAAVYGSYTMWVYLLALPGGFVADRFLGARRAVIAGGVIIALGHFTMIVPSLTTFYAGLALITLGTGLLKPSISAMVGELYAVRDSRRDAGFALFFMGINIGAAAAPIVCGYLAQAPSFQVFLGSVGMSPLHSWHWGFGAAGVGMVIGLVQFLLSQKYFQRPNGAEIGDCKYEEESPKAQISLLQTLQSLTRDEWRRVGVVGILFFFTVIFGTVSEQAGSSMSLFADRLTRTSIFGWTFPSSWFQSVVPLYVIMLSPVLSTLWLRMGDRQPSGPAKFAFSLLFVALALLVMLAAAVAAQGGKVSPLWLLSAFFFQEIGAVLLNPTGLSLVTKLAPARLVGVMMGIWFLASAVASRIAGFLAGFFDESNTVLIAQYFGILALLMLLSALALALLTPRVRRMMGGVR
jgi:proton-dependent oligopeptide transporter, POT family